jgi:hypothetical protein
LDAAPRLARAFAAALAPGSPFAFVVVALGLARAFAAALAPGLPFVFVPAFAAGLAPAFAAGLAPAFAAVDRGLARVRAAAALGFADGLALAARPSLVFAVADVAAAVGPEDAARSPRLALRRTGRERGRLVMTSRSESSSSGTMRMMPRALRHPGTKHETNDAPTRSCCG